MDVQCHNDGIRRQINDDRKSDDTKNYKTTQFNNIIHFVVQHINSSLNELFVALRLKFPTDGFVI